MALEISPLGDSALIVRRGESLDEVLALMRQLEHARIEGVIDLAPGFASVALFFKEPPDFERIVAVIRQAVARKAPSARTIGSKIRRVEIPVCYDPEFGCDLEEVARHCQLSPNDIVKRHRGAQYRVRCLGFTPGFPFLSGLPPELATPRRATPRTAVPAGSVAIGGIQTGVYPLRTPGGWNIIGRTPLRLFDLEREPATLLQAGDRVRFRAIARQEFEKWGK